MVVVLFVLFVDCWFCRCRRLFLFDVVSVFVVRCCLLLLVVCCLVLLFVDGVDCS